MSAAALINAGIFFLTLPNSSRVEIRFPVATHKQRYIGVEGFTPHPSLGRMLLGRRGCDSGRERRKAAPRCQVCCRSIYARGDGGKEWKI